MSPAAESTFRLHDLPNGWRVGRFDALAETAGVVHAVTTRRGPVFSADVRGASPPADELARSLGLAGIAFCEQAHGNQVLVADAPGLVGLADALVTAEASLGVMGRSADCPLILAADRTGEVVGMAHASWRGTVARIASRLIETMAHRFGADPGGIVAGICPSAGPCCYEVGPEVRDAALNRIGPHADVFFPRRRGRMFFDLWSANADELQRCGLHPSNIHIAAICTICRNDLFPSFRAKGPTATRFAAVIAHT